MLFLVQPMPAFNLSSKPDEEPVAEPPASLPLRVEDLPMTETPPSRSLADSLAALIQGMDYKPNNFDSSLGKSLDGRRIEAHDVILHSQCDS